MRTPAHARTSFLVTPRLRALAQAPEVADAPDTYKGDLVDVWSLGVMLYVCVVCDYPFGAPALCVNHSRRTCLRGPRSHPPFLPAFQHCCSHVPRVERARTGVPRRALRAHGAACCNTANFLRRRQVTTGRAGSPRARC